MENVILDSIEQLDSLKRWLKNMQDRGTPKHFEMLIDGKRIVYKTDELEQFDLYKKWLTDFTQSLRVLVYNTKNTHRNQVFELRTEKYIDGQSNKLYATRKRSLSEDEIEVRAQAKFEEQKRSIKLSELAIENREIKKRLDDAESYITKLETENAKDKFDWDGIIKMMLPNVQQQMLGAGLEKKSAVDLNGTEPEQTIATFRKKEPKIDAPNTKQAALDDRERDLNMLQSAYLKLGEDLYSKTMDMFRFLNDYPEFIPAVNESLMQTANKLGWHSTH